jgi:branched-chain amino acid transport system substrate-binding protein
MNPLNNLKTVAAASVLTVAAMALPAQADETLGPVTDEVGVVKILKGDPIQIGTYYVISGPDTGLGLDQQRGVLIAASDRDNMVAGHPIRFRHEDSACTAEGGQNAATKLAANQKIVVVLGTACSSAATPGAPILWNAGIPSISTSASAPALTAPDRHESYYGFARTSINDIGQAEGDARWLYNHLGCKTLAAIHDGSPYSEQLVVITTRNFAETWGGTVTSVEAIDPQTVDMRPVLNKISTDKPCAIYFPIFVAAAAQVVRQAKDVSGLDGVELIGGGAVMTKDFMVATGKSVEGFRFTFPDLSTDTVDQERYPVFLARYEEMFGEAPIQGFHAWAYDGAVLAFNAIEKVAVTDDEGNTYIGRMALRDAIFATQDLKGLSGTISCDEFGDCKKFIFAVYQYNNPDPETFEPEVNPRRIFSDIGPIAAE